MKERFYRFDCLGPEDTSTYLFYSAPGRIDEFRVACQEAFEAGLASDKLHWENTPGDKEEFPYDPNPSDVFMEKETIDTVFEKHGFVPVRGDLFDGAISVNWSDSIDRARTRIRTPGDYED